MSRLIQSHCVIRMAYYALAARMEILCHLPHQITSRCEKVRPLITAKKCIVGQNQLLMFPRRQTPIVLPEQEFKRVLIFDRDKL